MTIQNPTNLSTELDNWIVQLQWKYFKSQDLHKEEQSGKICCPGIISHYWALIYEKKQIDKREGTESPERDPSVYENLIYERAKLQGSKAWTDFQ